ncbi:MAG: hypothetical protein U9R27_11260 [Campylobacterota bacterium]|nr:hypothetical protein [Campylobacterota bacterium]
MWGVSILLLLSGCEDYPVYSGYLTDKKDLSLPCITIDTFDPKLTKPLKKNFESISSKSCNYHLNGYIHHVDSCSNPQVKSLGADFNGYIRLKIFDGNRSIYRIQSDFKSDEDAALKRIIKQMKEEIF